MVGGGLVVAGGSSLVVVVEVVDVVEEIVWGCVEGVAATAGSVEEAGLLAQPVRTNKRTVSKAIGSRRTPTMLRSGLRYTGRRSTPGQREPLGEVRRRNDMPHRIAFRRSGVFALTVATLALVATACGGATGTAAAPTTSTDSGSSAMNTISVTGTGKVAGVPDTLVVSLGVSVVRPSIDAATGDAADLAQALIDALTSHGVAERDIQTTNYSISPEYDYRADSQKLIGYRVTNTVSAKIRNMDTAGETIDSATAAGGSDVVVQGISFDIESNEDLVVSAREAAWNDALAKASQLAELAGVNLGQAVSIQETTTPSGPPIPYAAEDMAGGASTPIQPGEQQVSVVIQVEFAIGG